MLAFILKCSLILFQYVPGRFCSSDSKHFTFCVQHWHLKCYKKNSSLFPCTAGEMLNYANPHIVLFFSMFMYFLVLSGSFWIHVFSPHLLKQNCFTYKFPTSAFQGWTALGNLETVSFLWAWCVGRGITYFSYSSDFLSLYQNVVF